MHPEVAKAGCGDKNYLFYNHLLFYFRWNPFLEMRTFLMTIRYFDQVLQCIAYICMTYFTCLYLTARLLLIFIQLCFLQSVLVGYHSHEDENAGSCKVY